MHTYWRYLQIPAWANTRSTTIIKYKYWRMKRLLLICLLSVGTTASFAISKKKLLQQRDSLLEKIEKEYVFTTNFDSIKAKAIKDFYPDFNKLMENVKEFSAAQYISRDEAPPKYMHIWNEREVEKFRQSLVFRDWFINKNQALMKTPKNYIDYSSCWNLEWNQILSKYPEARNLDEALRKKKTHYIGSINSILRNRWERNFDDVPSSLKEYIIEYNEKEKEDILHHYKMMYRDHKAYEKEQSKKIREKEEQYRRSVSPQYNSRWYEGAWLGARSGRIDADYIIKISSKQLRILYLNNVVYNGSYSVRGGYSDGYQRIVFGGNNVIVLDDSSNTIVYNGYKFGRN